MQDLRYTAKIPQVNGSINTLQELLKVLDVTCSEIRTHTVHVLYGLRKAIFLRIALQFPYWSNRRGIDEIK